MSERRKKEIESNKIMSLTNDNASLAWKALEEEPSGNTYKGYSRKRIRETKRKWRQKEKTKKAKLSE